VLPPYDDLRSYLEVLESERQLLRVSRQVKPEPDLGAAGRAAANLDGATAPALLFDNIDGYENATVALNVHGSWANHALMLGLPKQTPVREQFHELARRWEKFPVAVDRRQTAPWQEITVSQDINLFELLPLFRLNPGDGGPYIDKAAVITRDARAPHDYGKLNVGIYRLQVKGPDHLGIQAAAVHDVSRHVQAFPEVQAVNAMYTHGLVTIVSTKVRHAGFARVVGLRVLTTPHGIGYSKVVIVVDDTVDPFNLEQVMWALSTQFNPEFDSISVPRMYEIPLDPSSHPQGITTRLILDATTPVPPDVRGDKGQLITPYPEAAEWETILRGMLR
jgi:3-polyprenyl-4-hydroxybenzoate decarboxylase